MKNIIVFYETTVSTKLFLKCCSLGLAWWFDAKLEPN